MKFEEFIVMYQDDPENAAAWLKKLIKKGEPASLVTTAEEYIELAVEAPQLAPLFKKHFVVALFKTSEQFIELAQRANPIVAEQLFKSRPEPILRLFEQTDKLAHLEQVDSSLAKQIKSRKVLSLTSETPVVLTENQKQCIVKAMNDAILKTRYSSLGNEKVLKLNKLVELQMAFTEDVTALKQFIECASTPRSTWCFFQASYGKTGSAMAFKQSIKNSDRELFDLLFKQNLFNENQNGNSMAPWE